MVSFTVELAEVCIAIKALFYETESYLSEFITTKPPLEAIEIIYNDILKIKAEHPDFLDSMCEKAVLKNRIDKILVKYGVFPLHASSFAYNNRAYVLLALSGVGKSTHSRKWCEAFPDQTIMINDDRPYIKVYNDHAVVYSYPQAGINNIYNNVSFPVAVMAKIVRDETNYVKEIEKSAFFPFLVQQSFTLDDPEMTRSIVLLIKRVIDIIPLFEIHCNLEKEAAYVIEKQIKSYL